jgi:hypothetical protein
MFTVVLNVHNIDYFLLDTGLDLAPSCSIRCRIFGSLIWLHLAIVVTQSCQIVGGRP